MGDGVLTTAGKRYVPGTMQTTRRNRQNTARKAPPAHSAIGLVKMTPHCGEAPEEKVLLPGFVGCHPDSLGYWVMPTVFLTVCLTIFSISSRL